MPRLGHKKSRNGCRQCKARHVKCDENKPCSSCSRHGVQCSLVTWDDASLPPAQTATAAPHRVAKRTSDRPRKVRLATSSQPPSAAGLPIEYVLNPTPAASTGTPDDSSPPSDPFPYLTKFTNKTDAIQPNYWVRDLELMHHWTTEAHVHISARDDLRDMFRDAAPKQAIIHHFLMHEILAYSALHLAHERRDQRPAFRALGSHHQDLAIRSMRKMLPNMTPENGPALFMTATLVTVTVFASASTDATVTLDELFDIFSLIVGINSVLASTRTLVASSPFAPCLLINPNVVPQEPIFDLVLAQAPSFISAIETLCPEGPVRETALAAVATLKDCIYLSAGPHVDNRILRCLFFCPMRWSADFNALLRERHSAAMAIIALYSIILSDAGWNWFLEGWAQRVVDAVLDAIEPQWHATIQWCVEYVRERRVEQQEKTQQQQQPADGEGDGDGEDRMET
ncbi:hypothetical protein EJ04DRAFT_493366 [Polyplosphaeria fusca]|uniref:Zn(2)-C6 fungal-type domain-containing protein n=1 Tax=Polyplosphaeria fusca TaxID=682080 RepID=A0A9P4V2P1_9PLEO|nr:hypothetical protein EJ04DRAFT_493366 [Polyplosphaeria fusca]